MRHQTPDAHPTSRFGMTMRRNLVAPTLYHKKQMGVYRTHEWLLCGGSHSIAFPRFEVILNIISKEDIAYCVTISDISHCTCLDFTKISSQLFGKVREWVYCEHCFHVFRFLCKVDSDNDKFIHASKYTFDEVMRLLELVGGVDCEWCSEIWLCPHA